MNPLSASPHSQVAPKNWQKIRKTPAVLEKFLMREKVVDGIRAFFKTNGFHEVETPLLVQHPGTEPYLEVFETKLLSADGQTQPAFLLTSPEYAMKKLLVAGMGPIFQICKSFRNGEGISSRHNPEFSILEWYRPNADYTAIMDDCENLLASLCKMATGGTILKYQGRSYDLTPGWERISVPEAFAKYVGVDLETMLSEEKLKAAAVEAGYTVTSDTTWEQVFNQFLLNKIEPNLGQTAPTILYDYPASQAALSRRKSTEPRLAERFEFFVAGLEIGNAFSELTDGEEQERRFADELRQRAELGKTPYKMDHDYIEALKVGMPETGGIAVGVDRLVMLFADAATLADVTYFPVQDVFDEE